MSEKKKDSMTYGTLRDVADEFQTHETGFFRLLSIISWFLPFGFMNSMIALYVLPKESVAIFGQDATWGASIMYIIIGGCMVSGPLWGKISDESTFEMGRRRPYVIIGSLICAFAFIGLSWASQMKHAFMYIIFLLIGMISLQMVSNAQHGLIPDFVPTQKQGEAGGLLGICECIGATSAFIYIWTSGDSNVEMVYIYFAIITMISMFTTCVAANEKPGYLLHDSVGLNEITKGMSSNGLILPDVTEIANQKMESVIRGGSKSGSSSRSVPFPDDGSLRINTYYSRDFDESESTNITIDSVPLPDDGSLPINGKKFIDVPVTRQYIFGSIPILRWNEISDCYGIDTTEVDFNYVLLARFFYNVAISSSTLYLFWLRDAAHVHEERLQLHVLGETAVVTQGCAAFFSFPFGLLSNVIGRKPIFYLGVVILNMTLLANILIQFTQENVLTYMIPICAAKGISSGLLLSVDTALVLDVLPSKHEAAKYMGKWSLSSFTAVLVGPAFYFAILNIGGRVEHGIGYDVYGYHAVFICVGIFSTASAIVVSKIVSCV